MQSRKGAPKEVCLEVTAEDGKYSNLVATPVMWSSLY